MAKQPGGYARKGILCYGRKSRFDGAGTVFVSRPLFLSFACSESFVDVEHEARLSALAEAIVQADVHVFLEFPAVAYSVVGQHVREAHRAELVEHRACAHPCHESVALPHFLPQLHLRFHLVLVAVSAYIVAAHGVWASQLGHHSPRGVAEVERAAQVAGYRRAAPQASVGVGPHLGCGECMVVSEESGAESLLYAHVDAAVRVGDDVACVVDERQSQPEVACLRVHAVEQFGPFHVGGVHEVVGGHGAEIQPLGHPYEEAGLGLCLLALHVRLVSAVVSVGVADAPVLAWERVEVECVVEPVPVVREDVQASHAEHIEPNGGHVAEERHV